MPSNNAQKTWIARSLNLAAQQQALNAIGQLGKALPATIVSCTGWIVKVSFQVSAYNIPQTTMPAWGPVYDYQPYQPGDKGIVIPVDVAIGSVSGLGAGGSTPPTINSLYANLSALVWVPVGNSAFAAPDDANARCIYGPDGAIIASIDKTVMVRFTKSAVSVTPVAGVPIELNGDVVVSGALQIGGAIEAVGGGVYAGDLKTSGNIVAGVGTSNQVGLRTHDHSGVTTGGGNSGPPVPGT